MKHLVVYFFIFFCNWVQSQVKSIESSYINTVIVDADIYVGRDSFATQYYLKNNVLYKKTDVATMQYQNVAFGKITKVDISNPLKILLFYQDFNAIIILDNQLNEIQKVDFSVLSIPVVASAVGISGQNQFWIYNSLNQQIGLYDLVSNKYNDLGVPIKETFRYYQTDFNYFHWIDSQNQWMTCSIFGRVFSKGTIDDFEQVQLVENDKLVYLINNQLYFKDIKNDLVFEIKIVEKTFKNYYYKDQILSIFTDRGITNYKIILP